MKRLQRASLLLCCGIGLFAGCGPSESECNKCSAGTVCVLDYEYCARDNLLSVQCVDACASTTACDAACAGTAACFDAMNACLDASQVGHQPVREISTPCIMVDGRLQVSYCD